MSNVRRLPVPNHLLQIRIELKWLEPTIWRKIVVPDTITFKRLHDVIQVVMGWTDSHLHEFYVGDLRIGTSDPEWDSPGSVTSESRTRLGPSLGRLKTFSYIYDFGDSWEHKLKVEKLLPLAAVERYPLCLDGERAVPPEDVGGPPGYIDFLEAISNPQHPEHQSTLDWYGTEFDPAEFNLERVNKILARMKI